MNYNFLPVSDEEKPKIGKKDDGILKIEVPHWTTQLQIHDGSLGNTFEPGKITAAGTGEKEFESGQNSYQSELTLPAGTYRVKASLEGKSEENWVKVIKGQVTQIPQKVWGNLEFTSSAPLVEISNANQPQTQAVAEWSGKKTWKKYQKGGSSFFLFIRTLNPKNFEKNLLNGLRLLSETGELVSDFSTGVVKDAAQGWLAFNSGLREGGYILLSGGRGARRRFQPVYLCRDWQTRIFLDAGKKSLLENASINMTRFQNRPEAAFRPMDETATVAEAVLNFLRFDSDGTALFNNDRIEILLDDKTEDPWLGILAAHAIHKLKKQTAADSRTVYDQYFELLDSKILPFLAREIPSHPDVKALLLNNLSPPQSFVFPPMLWRGLERIYEFNNSENSIIRKDGLIDCLTDQVLGDSPWTAWRDLNRMPAFENAPKNKSLLTILKAKKRALPKNIRLPAIIPKAPVYRRQSLSRYNTRILRSGKSLAAENLSMLMNELPPVQKSKQIIVDYVLPDKNYSMPLSVTYDANRELEALLKDVDPADVSRNSSLSTAEADKNLRELKAELGNYDQSVTFQDPSAQQTVVLCSLAQSDSRMLRSALPEQTENSGISVLEIINRLKTEAERISVKSGERKNYGKKTLSVKKAAADIKRLISDILKLAEYTLVSNKQGEIVYCSGAFLELLSFSAGARRDFDGKGGKSLSGEREKIWTNNLRSISPGLNNISIPEFPRGFKKWSVRRVLLKPEKNDQRREFYLDVIHLKGFPTLNLEALRNIGEAVFTLANYSSLMAYGAEEKCEEYLQNLKQKVDVIRELIDKSKIKNK